MTWWSSFEDDGAADILMQVTAQQLFKDLDTGKWKPFCLVVGEEPFQAAEILARLKGFFLAISGFRNSEICKVSTVGWMPMCEPIPREICTRIPGDEAERMGSGSKLGGARLTRARRGGPGGRPGRWVPCKVTTFRVIPTSLLASAGMARGVPFRSYGIEQGFDPGYPDLRRSGKSDWRVPSKFRIHWPCF
jgi:hypothetical protein